MSIPRRGLLLLPLLAAGCGGEAPGRTSFVPPAYGYLVPLRLNVAAIEEAAPPPPGPLDDINPVPPAQALIRMAQDRLSAGGSLGRALFTVEDATITRTRDGRDGLDGTLAVRLDVQTSDGTRAGFAEARVSRRAAGIGGDLRGALYDLTTQMMQDMNVEFEFQVRQSLREWLQDATTAPPPPAVEQQSLTPPR